MFFYLIIAFFFSNQTAARLEGSWKMKDFSGVENLKASKTYNDFSDEKKLEVLQGMDYVLENTFYSFKGDSVFFTNATPYFTVSKKKGRFILNSDTLSILESGKVNMIKFFISSYSDEEMTLRFVNNVGELGPTKMIFERIE